MLPTKERHNDETKTKDRAQTKTQATGARRAREFDRDSKYRGHVTRLPIHNKWFGLLAMYNVILCILIGVACILATLLTILLAMQFGMWMAAP